MKSKFFAMTLSLFLLLGSIFARATPPVQPADDALDVVSRIDYGLGLLLQGKYHGFLLCQGENYPVQFKLSYSGTAGQLWLDVAVNFQPVADKVLIGLAPLGSNATTNTTYDDQRDFGWAQFSEVHPTSAQPYRVHIDLRKSNQAIDCGSPGLGLCPREVGLLGRQGNRPSTHSFNSRCLFYDDASISGADVGRNL